MPTRVLSALVVAAVGTTVAAQQPARPQQPTPTFKSAIDLVQVDVVVLDENGRHVHGLKASDFTLLDRRKPQAVAAFDEVNHEGLAEASGPTLPPTVRRDVASNTT